jgi:hypothetical protein
VIALVGRLLFARCPSAIAGLVVSVHVDAIYGVLDGRRRAVDATLESQENSEPGDEEGDGVAPPEEIRRNILDLDRR